MNWGMIYMNNKEEFLIAMEENVLQSLDKKDALLHFYLLFFEKQETDQDLWNKLIALTHQILNQKHKLYRNQQEEKKYLAWEMSHENIQENQNAEKQYDNLTEIEKLIFSYRVLCPKSSDYNFNPFF